MAETVVLRLSSGELPLAPSPLLAPFASGSSSNVGLLYSAVSPQAHCLAAGSQLPAVLETYLHLPESIKVLEESLRCSIIVQAASRASVTP